MSNDELTVHSKAQLVQELQSLLAQLAALQHRQIELGTMHSGQSKLVQRERAIWDYFTEAIVILDVEGSFACANPAAEKLFGSTSKELAEIGPFALSPPIQTDGRSSRDIMLNKIKDALGGGEPIFEWWPCTAEGQRFPCEIRLVRMPWDNRDVIRATIVDCSQSKLLEISELGRRGILEGISRDAPLSESLDSLVRMIENLLPEVICSVLLLDHETNCLRYGAATSLPDFYNAAIDGVTIGPMVGSCGAAAFTGQRVVVSDIMSHPNWVGFRQLAERAQLKACWSEPIISPLGSVLGTFAVYYRDAGEPAPVELKAIEIASQLTAITIEYDLARRSQRAVNATLQSRIAEETKHLSEANQSLRSAEQEVRLSAVAFDTHDSIMITDRNGKILNVNRSFTNLTGYTPKDVIGKTPRILKSGRHDEEFYGQMWKAISETGYWEGEVWNKRKDGEVYLQRLTVACVKNESGETTHYVGDGQDLTLVKQAEAQKAAIQAAHSVQQSLLPSKAPFVPGFDIAGRVLTAEHASGDFFDYISFGQDAVGVLVADVCGHGLGPALLAAETQAFTRALAESDNDPSQLLTRVNRLMAKTDAEGFVTMFLCRFEQETSSLTYAGAGHQGYLFCRNGKVKVLKSTGLPLGVNDENALPPSTPIVLHPGEIVLLPTDGVEEACSVDGRLFGQKRMLDVVHNNREKSAAEIVDILIRATSAFEERQLDDITVVVVKTVFT